MNKLLLLTHPDCLDERAIITEEGEDKVENIVMGIFAASGNGINMQGINASDFVDGNQTMVLCFVWQALKQYVLRNINLHDTPEI